MRELVGALGWMAAMGSSITLQSWFVLSVAGGGCVGGLGACLLGAALGASSSFCVLGAMCCGTSSNVLGTILPA